MTKKITVLGGGLVGGFIARRMAHDPQLAVTLVDLSEETLRQNSESAELAGTKLRTRQADLGDEGAIHALIADADLVMGAMPGHLGFSTLKSIISAGKNCVDISFFPEDPFELDALARERSVRAVVDCGVMPGLGGMLAAYFASQLDVRGRLSICVGGLPVERIWPWEYRAPFSPSDVIEEYLRPARLRIAGMTFERPALSDIELVDLPGVGTLEAFNTDGLRTLLATLDYENMVEKTLRYPGHAEKMRMLRDAGFFSSQPMAIDGTAVTPLELTSRLLFDMWRLEPGMQELTVMRVEAEGLSGGKHRVLVCDLLDYSDPLTGDFSMARTTGYPAIVAAELLLAGELNALHGVIAPEQLCLGAAAGVGAAAEGAAGSALAEQIFEKLTEKGLWLAFSEEPGDGDAGELIDRAVD